MPIAPLPKCSALGASGEPRRKRVRVLFPHLLAASAEEQPKIKVSGVGDRAKSPGGLKPMVKEGTPPSEVAHVSQRSRRTANKKGDAGIAITPPAKIIPLPPNLKPSSTHVVPATSGGELEWGALKITPREFECLEDGKMLNDSVIDFFLLLIKNYLAPWDGASCDLFPRRDW